MGFGWSVDRDAFLHAVRAAARISNTKHAIPILQHVLVRAAGGRLDLHATDITTSLRTHVSAAIGKPEAVCLPAAPLQDALAAMPPGAVTVDISEAWRATFRSGKRRAEVIGQTGQDYPEVSSPPTDWIALKAGALRQLLGTVQHAMSTDDQRPHLNAAFLETREGNLVAVATDGHRLAMDEIASSANLSVLLPARAVTEASWLLKSAKDDDEVGLAVRNPEVFFRIGNTVTGTKLLEATFPAYRQVLPSGCERSARVARETLIDATEAVADVSRAKGLRLDFRGAAVRLESDSPDRGEGEAEVDCVLQGRPLRIGVEGRYLLEALRALRGEEVEIQLGGELDPIVMRAEGPALSLVMPMRI